MCRLVGGAASAPPLVIVQAGNVLQRCCVPRTELTSNKQSSRVRPPAAGGQVG